jgi:hypothetical protein
MVNMAPDTPVPVCLFPSPSGARKPPCGGDLEITKLIFGFKGALKKISKGRRQGTRGDHAAALIISRRAATSRRRVRV